jgi:hypothetical protein
VEAAHIHDSFERREVVGLDDRGAIGDRKAGHRIIEYLLIGRVFRQHLKW